MTERTPLVERLRKVECVTLDVDGVLTDGRIFVADDGKQLRAFDVKDGSGIIYLQRAGIRVALLSGESHDAVRHRAERLGIRNVLLGYRNKSKGLAKLLSIEEMSAETMCYVGDDLPDLPVMRTVGVAIAVADAHPLVRESADWVTRRPGGRGAVREVAERLLQAQGKWESILSRYAPERTM